jgi:hypothetical protein
VRVLCGHGANVHHRNVEGRDALFLAVMRESRKLVLFLAAQGAEVGRGRRRRRRMMMMIMMMRRRRMMMMMMMMTLPQVDSPDVHGLTALLWACKYRPANTPLIRTLLALGADVTARDAAGNTSLHLAVGGGHGGELLRVGEWTSACLSQNSHKDSKSDRKIRKEKVILVRWGGVGNNIPPPGRQGGAMGGSSLGWVNGGVLVWFME